MLSAPGHDARRRQLRLRVLEALEGRVKGFVRREELWPLRIPREPLLLETIVQGALHEDARAFDVATLRSRPLLHFDWEDGSVWDAWVIVLPSGLKLYCDSTADEDRVLASGGRNEGDDSDRAFLQLLAESAGSHFGIELSGDAPSRVRAAIGDREFLLDILLNLFEVAGMENAVRRQLSERGNVRRTVDGGDDFRADVDQWLDRALTA